MAWTYEQRTGRLSLDGKLVSIGYAGSDDGDGVTEPGEGFNDPAAQYEKNVGPLPVGRYRICPPVAHPHVGPFALQLAALPGNDMRGRDGFFIHGEGPKPGASSQGCMIFSRPVREKIWSSGDHELEVISGIRGAKR